jgi:hypothetical protein
MAVRLASRFALVRLHASHHIYQATRSSNWYAGAD